MGKMKMRKLIEYIRKMYSLHKMVYTDDEVLEFYRIEIETRKNRIP